METQAAAPVVCEIKSPKLDARPRAVSVNGITIPRGDIARETQNHAASTPIAAWKAAARALVIRELLRQEAGRHAIVATPLEDEDGRRETPDEAAMRALLERDIRVPSADEATCRRYYEQNRARFRSAPLYAVRHILLAAASGDIEARDAARTEAQRLLAILAERPEAFGRLAGECSACPSGRNEGHLGQIGPGQTVPEFETALGMMSADGTPVLVETRYGIHVVALDQKVEGQDVPFEIVSASIAAYLDETVRRRAMQQYVTILASSAAIVGIELTPDGQPPHQ
jgi:peptidyl-prolyl cis-trans isomerase C